MHPERPGQKDRIESTRRSWNAATRNHNAHKGDQARFLAEGGDTLFPDEIALLGDLAGARLVHLQCNAGQDSLCLARRGAQVTGVDLSDEAIAFAQALSEASGIAARFTESEIVAWLGSTDERFDIAFGSYGALGWNEDLDAWFRGVRRVLAPGGRLVLLEFHPLVWSFKTTALDGDDYFAEAPFVDPVGDYVAESGAGLLAVERSATTIPNTTPAYSYQYGLGTTVTAAARAGLRIERLVEYPYANGCKLIPSLVASEGRRYVWPEGAARVPLMFGLVAGCD